MKRLSILILWLAPLVCIGQTTDSLPFDTNYFKWSASGKLQTTATGGGASLANPSGTVGLSAVNGSASTAMRSDATPPLSQAINPTWTGIHTFTKGTIIGHAPSWWGPLDPSLVIFADTANGYSGSWETFIGGGTSSSSASIDSYGTATAVNQVVQSPASYVNTFAGNAVAGLEVSISGTKRTYITPGTASGSASGGAYSFDTAVTLSNVDDKIQTWRNGGSAQKASVNYDGSLSIQGRTNRIGDNGSALTYNGTAIGSGSGSSIILTNASASRAVVTDASTNLTTSATTATELGYVSGVTSAIQTQFAGKQATGNYVTALTGDVTASGPGSVAATVAKINGATLGTTTATSGNMLVATNSQWVSTAMSGDATLANSGALTLKNTGTAGTYGDSTHFPIVTTDANGRVTVVTTQLVSTSSTTNFNNLNVTNNVTIGGTVSLTNNFIHTATTPTLGSGSTNIVVDYRYSDLYLVTSTNMNLASFSNSAASGQTVDTILTIFASGANVSVTSALGSIKIANASVAFPVTITNGCWGVFSFKNYAGSNATNHGVAYSYVN